MSSDNDIDDIDDIDDALAPTATTPAPAGPATARAATRRSAAERDRARFAASQAEAEEPGEEPPDTTDSAVRPAGGASSRIGWVVAVGVLVALVIVAGSYAWVQHRHADDLSGQHRDRLAASQLMGSFSETLLTYNTAKPDANLPRAQSMATAAFKPKVASLLGPGTAGTNPGGAPAPVRTTAQASAVYINEVRDGRAEGVVTLDMTLTNGGQPLQAVYYGKVGAKREHGKWKIDSFEPVVLGAKDNGAAPASPSSSTPSTPSTPAAPSPSSSTP